MFLCFLILVAYNIISFLVFMCVSSCLLSCDVMIQFFLFRMCCVLLNVWTFVFVLCCVVLKARASQNVTSNKTQTIKRILMKLQNCTCSALKVSAV
jgi:hypothetical protein